MCIFSAPVSVVSGTSIVVGRTRHGNIRVVYCNKVACDNGNVMVLPIESDKVELFKLRKKYKTLGQDIADGYKEYQDYLNPTYSFTNGFSNNSSQKMAAVFEYGPYDVSLVKDLNTVNWDHFGGLDNKKRFFNFMNNKYINCTYLIAKIRPVPENKGTFIDIHKKNDDKIPILYEFKPRSSNFIIPTYHIHNGKPEKNPDWDHYILLLNGGISNNNIYKKLKSIKKEDFKRFFGSVNSLFNDNDFNHDPYEKFKYLNILRVSDSNFPNMDLVCSYLPIKRNKYRNRTGMDQYYSKFYKNVDDSYSNTNYANNQTESKDINNNYILYGSIFLLVMFFIYNAVSNFHVCNLCDEGKSRNN